LLHTGLSIRHSSTQPRPVFSLPWYILIHTQTNERRANVLVTAGHSQHVHWFHSLRQWPILAQLCSPATIHHRSTSPWAPAARARTCWMELLSLVPVCLLHLMVRKKDRDLTSDIFTLCVDRIGVSVPSNVADPMMAFEAIYGRHIVVNDSFTYPLLPLDLVENDNVVVRCIIVRCDLVCNQSFY
jgi:hypothetical protein